MSSEHDDRKQKNGGWGDGSPVKYMVFKHGNLSLDSQDPHKKLGGLER